jgi:hypothetical protein
VRDCQRAAGFVRGSHEPFGLLRGLRQRFLNEHVLAGPQRRLSHEEVLRRLGRDDERLDITVSQHVVQRGGRS